MQQGHLLAYLFADEFIPPHAELPPAFAQLVAAGAVYAVRAFAKAEAWPEVGGNWADQLWGVASAPLPTRRFKHGLPAVRRS